MTTEEMEKAIAEVWAMFKETDLKFKETDLKFKETDLKFKETDLKFKETDRKMSQTQEQMAEADKKLSKKIDKLTDSWSRFIECFLAPGIPKAFQERGIAIIGTSERQKRTVAGKQMEIDILGVNSDCVVAVEVKTTLRPEYVGDFLEKLPRFKQFFPEYRDRIVYGAMAGIEIVQAGDECAINRGLWVITQRGDAVVIQNDQEFKPQTW